MDKVNDTLSKIESDNTLTTEQLKELQQELTSVTSPIMQKLYSQSNNGEGEGQDTTTQPSNYEDSTSAPNIEEVD